MANKIHGYTVVAYPESMPAEWQDKLDKLPFGYVYNKHDKDVDKNGEIKKAHIHFFFQGKATKKQKEYIHASLGVAYGEDVRSNKGMFDYLTHENHPDKYHYSRDSIQASPKWCQELFESECVDTPDYTGDMVQFIEMNDICEYSELIYQLVQNEDSIHLLSISKQYWVIRYIDSRRNRKVQNDN